MGAKTQQALDDDAPALLNRALDRVGRRIENIAEHASFIVEGVSLKHRRGG